MTTYTITRRDEETECSYCADPQFIGDDVFMSANEQFVYCSISCAQADERNQAQLVKPQPESVKAGCFDI